LTATSPTAELRQLLRDRSLAVADAIRSGAPIAPEEIEVLERLTRLVAADDAAPPARRRPAWPVALLLGATLLVVSTLLFARVRATEIEMELDASELTFTLARQDVLLRNVMVDNLAVSGLDRIALPLELERAFGNGTDDPDLAISLQVVQPEQSDASITIGALAPPPATAVRLRLVDAGEYRLSMHSPEFGLRVDVVGQVIVAVSGSGRQQVDLPVPEPITLIADSSGIVDLDITFRDLARQNIAVQVPVRELGFMRMDEFGARDVQLVRPLSTILSGTLYFESLNGVAHTVRPGERLRFAKAEGEIRSLRLHEDRLSILWAGRVSGMHTGSDDRPRNLMPTWLDWLRARHGLSLLWGTTLYLFGIFLGVWRWLRTPF
jgi:hypothetical protein